MPLVKGIARGAPAQRTAREHDQRIECLICLNCASVPSVGAYLRRH